MSEGRRERRARLPAVARIALLLLAALALSVPRAAAHSPHDVIEAWAISPAFPQDRTLFVALPRFNLVLRSTDAGESWQSVNEGLDTAYVTQLVVSPNFASDRTLWCVEISGLFTSQDAGESWERVEVPEGLREIVGFAVSPACVAAVPFLAAATRRSGIWFSRDWGNTWIHTEPIQHQTVGQASGPIAFLPTTAPMPATVHAVCEGSSVFGYLVSMDLMGPIDRPPGFAHGPAPPSSRITALAVGPSDSGQYRYWIGTSAGAVLRHEDVVGEDSWHPEGDLPDGARVLHLSVAHESDGAPTLFAATADHGLLIRTGDGPWRGSLAGFREKTHQTKEHWLGSMPSPGWAEDRTVFACAFEGLYVSRDGGETWRWLNVLHPQLVRNFAFSPRFADDGTLWFSTYGAGLLRSDDRGRSFGRVDTAGWGFPDGIAVAPDWRRAEAAPAPEGSDVGATADGLAPALAPASGALLVGTPNNLLLSTDGGATSAATNAGAKGFPRVLAFAPDWERSGTAFAHLSVDTGLKANRFVRTGDRGQSWADTSVRTVYDLAFSPRWEQDGRAWAAGPVGLLASTDRGLTFARVASLEAVGLRSVAIAPGAGADDPPVLATVSLGRGLFVSPDGGATWAPASGELPARPAAVEISPDFAHDGLLIVGTHNAGVWVSRDQGAHWTRGAGGPRMALAMELSPTFARDRTLVVGSYERPWISEDAGATWRALELPVPADYLPDVSREPVDPDAVLPPARR